MLYADDLILLLEGDALRTALEGVMEVVKRFGHFSGKKLNTSKCHALYKGPNRDQVQELLAVYDIPRKAHVRYLVIGIGDSSPQGAMAGWLAEALRRAKLIAVLRITLREKVKMLKVYRLPVVAGGARAYLPTTGVVSHLGTIYKTVLVLTSWCPKPPIFS